MRDSNKIFKYGMRLRPFDIGSQPKGFLKWSDEENIPLKDDPSRVYHSIVWYGHRLTEKEMFDYDLDYLGECERL